MSEREIIKKYIKEDLTIVWKPKICIHAEECVKRLPEVYKPEDKPWIQPENASIEALKEQIDTCPSGALSYNNENNMSSEQNLNETKVEVRENGPLLVHGDLNITKPGGGHEIKNKVTAFCRCGASLNKPYCDGKHNKIGFVG